LQAEDYVELQEELTSEGFEVAADHYFKLHSVTERFPQLLSLFKQREADKFGKLYKAALEQHLGASKELDYDDEATICAIRQVFDDFGAWLYGTGTEEDRRRAGTSIRIYARLPKWKRGVVGTSVFYPAAALPSKAVLKGYFDRWGAGWRVPGNADCLAAVSRLGAFFLDLATNWLLQLEELLQRGQTVWTIAAQGTNQTKNEENWYHASTRGLHQIVMRLYEHREIGSVEARLSEVSDNGDEAVLTLTNLQICYRQ
jgi:hypothetical protein